MKKFFSNTLNIVLTISLVAVLACATILAFNLLGIGKGKEVIAQDLTGKTVTEVQEWISSSKLSEDKYSFIYEYDDVIPENVLIYQSVKEGDVIKDNISFVFSKGMDPEKIVKNKITVPDFSAFTEEEIRNWGDVNKVTMNIDYVYSDTVAKGSLISQSIAAEGEVEESGSIDIVLSNGKSGGNTDNTIKVPDTYLGYTEANFIKAIEALGLKPVKQSKTYKNPSYKNGTVYSYQSSSDGIIFKKGDTVKYYLVDNGSEADETVTVPDSYLGYTEANFIKAIEALGLKASKQSKTYTSQRYATGTVYAYDSSSDGITFKKGDTVKYYLVDNGDSTEEETVIVPDSYIGYTEANFISAIKALGLNPVKQTKTYTSQRYATGTVYAYDSTSDGITFKKGDNVKYYLVDNGSGGSGSGSSSTNVTLANLVGKTQSEAESYLSSNGLNANITTAYSSSVAAGNVISMNPAAGTSVAAGSTVTLTISSGVETAPILAPNMLISNYSKTTYQDTVNALNGYFSAAGFTNVNYTGVSSTKSIGQIVSISVNGNTSYSAGNYPTNVSINVEIVNERIS